MSTDAHYRKQDVHGKTVYVCITCERPVSKGSLTLHTRSHDRDAGRYDASHAAEVAASAYAEAVVADRRAQVLRSQYEAFLWDHLGVEVTVTLERRGIERTYIGKVVAHASGAYSIGESLLVPGLDGFPVRWASSESVTP